MKEKTKTWIKEGVLFVFIFCSFMTYGQRIEQDIFDDLVYKTNQYEAKLTKTIFDDLLFTDSNKNKIEFNEAYLEYRMGERYNELDFRAMFFQDLVLDYRHISGYEATYEVDILGKLTIKDNQGKKVTAKEDIFGNLKIETEDKQVKSSIQKKLTGDLEYTSGRQSAVLTKDVRGMFMYTDSNKTKIELSQSVWQQFLKQYKTEYDVFSHLIEEFLLKTR